MALYYTIIVTSYLLCFFDFAKSKLDKFLIYFSYCAFITAVVSFRQVGIDNDSIAYQEMFISYSNSTFNQIIAGGYGYVEKGYVFLNKLVFIFGGGYRTLLIIVAVSTALFNYSFFWKKSGYIFISLLFYISFFYLYRDFTQIRYGLSAAICMWSIHYFFKKRYLFAIILFLLALNFHNAAVIVPLAVFIIMMFKNHLYYIIIPIPCIFIGRLLNLKTIFSFFGFESDHMHIYFEDESLGSASISLIGYGICLLYFFLIKYRGSALDKSSYILITGDFYFKLVSIAVAMNFLFINISIFQRFSYILFQFIIILISISVSLMAERIKERYIFIIFYFIIATFFLFYGIRMINEDLVRPYNLFFL
jgi:transmembrane protein EpsG